MNDLLITDATLLDIETGALHGGSSVRVRGDRVAEVALGRTLDAEPPSTSAPWPPGRPPGSASRPAWSARASSAPAGS